MPNYKSNCKVIGNSITVTVIDPALSEMDPGGPGDGWAQSPIEYKPEPSTLMQTGDKKGFVVHYVYFKVQLNSDTISKDIGPAMRMGSSKQVQP